MQDQEKEKQESTNTFRPADAEKVKHKELSREMSDEELGQVAGGIPPPCKT